MNLAACSELRFGQILTAVVAKFYQNPIFKSSFAIVIRLENYVPCGAWWRHDDGRRFRIILQNNFFLNNCKKKFATYFYICSAMTFPKISYSIYITLYYVLHCNHQAPTNIRKWQSLKKSESKLGKCEICRTSGLTRSSSSIA